jgi:dihydrofolate synthase/folylpolyglutamate synthase
MRGAYQLRNAACALMALACLRDRYPVTQSQVRQGLTTAVLPGRFQTLAGRPLRVLDVAHNAEAAAVLAENLRAQPVTGRTIGVCGMLQDKPVEAVAQMVAPLMDEWFVAGLAGVRGMTGELLAERLRAGGVRSPVHVRENVADAWRAAEASARHDDRIVGFGSFHTVGDILATLQREAGNERDGK